jgi:hypothetical protein
MLLAVGSLANNICLIELLFQVYPPEKIIIQLIPKTVGEDAVTNIYTTLLTLSTII